MADKTATDETGQRLPIGAVYALAEAETRKWWRSWGCTEFSGQDFANHRKFVEVPRAEKQLRELLALPKANRDAIARCLMRSAAP